MNIRTTVVLALVAVGLLAGCGNEDGAPRLSKVERDFGAAWRKASVSLTGRGSSTPKTALTDDLFAHRVRIGGASKEKIRAILGPPDAVLARNVWSYVVSRRVVAMIGAKHRRLYCTRSLSVRLSPQGVANGMVLRAEQCPLGFVGRPLPE